MPGSPCCTQLGISLARRRGHELGSFPAGGLQQWVSGRALAVLHSRVEPRTRGSGDVFGHAPGVGLRQLTGCTGADEPGLLAYLAHELRADALGSGAKGGNLR